MRQSVLILVFVSCCSLAFGQSEPNSITVSASQNVSLQPDQAIFAVTVQSSISTGLDDVLAALQGSGITAANLSGVSTPGQLCPTISCSQAPTLQWAFSLTGPLANTKATVASLTTLQQSIAKLNNGLTLSFSIAGTAVSQQLAQSQTCSLSGLIANATTQAQALAGAANVSVGRILAISSTTSNGVSNSAPVFAELSSVEIYAPSATAPPCAVTVKFALTGY
jgi:uncharacterized protein YggE